MPLGESPEWKGLPVITGVSILFTLTVSWFYMGVLRVGETIIIRGRLARRVRGEAERLGVSVDEYLVEVLSRDLDPKDRALEYVEASKDLLEEAREELGRGNVRQASEKLWEAAALAIKAYANWREGRRLTSHGELWGYTKTIAEELGDWVSDAWAQANAMHACFYEGWCTEWHVEQALKKIRKLVREVALLVKRTASN